MTNDAFLEEARARMLAYRDKHPARFFDTCDPDVPDGVLCGRPPSRLRLLWWRLTNWIPMP